MELHANNPVTMATALIVKSKSITIETPPFLFCSHFMNIGDFICNNFPHFSLLALRIFFNVVLILFKLNRMKPNITNVTISPVKNATTPNMRKYKLYHQLLII